MRSERPFAGARRRRTRVALVLAANALCLFVLWRTLAPSGAASAAPSASEVVDGATASEVAGGASESALALATMADRSDSHDEPEPSSALGERDLARAASDGEAPPPSAARASDDSKTAAGRRDRGRDGALQARLLRTTQSWTEKAVRETRGKLDRRRLAIAVHVRELGRAKDLVSIHADRPMRPASNMKLVTTAAALCALGPKWSYETVFTATAPIAGGRLAGDLVVRGGGDPLFEEDGDGEVAQRFEPVLRALAAQGVTAVDGALVLDEGDFAAPAPAPGWPDASQHWEEFCALSGAFSANAGCLTAIVRNDGGRARVDVHPRAHGLERKFKVTLGGAKSKLDVRVGVRAGTVIVEGSLPRSVPEWKARFAAPDPVELFARSLADAFQRHGIRVRDGWKRERRARSGGERELARLATPLVSTLVPINTHSNNSCADQLFLAMGHAVGGGGTRAGGSRATARALEELGVSASGMVQIDGSGLSRDNRTTARQITALVDAVLAEPAETARLFADSLAVAGATGTLDGRMQDPRLRDRVHAKTGFIAGTSALSGFVDTHDGRTLVFSILVEYPPTEGLNASCWKPMQDELCTELVESDG